jgi:hypothetical protein
LKWLEARLGHDNFKKLEASRPENEVGSHTVIGENLQAVLARFEEIKQSFATGALRDEGRLIRLPGELNNTHDPEQGIIDGDILLSE